MELDKIVDTESRLPPARSEHGHLVPGRQSLNPAGRPKKGQTYLDRLAAKLDQYGDDAAQAMIAQALKGNVRAHEYLRDTILGKPVEKMVTADVSDPGVVLLMQIAEMMGLRVVEPSQPALPEAEALPIDASSEALPLTGSDNEVGDAG